jgi:hypothetical protein
MKLSQGKANPAMVGEILVQKLSDQGQAAANGALGVALARVASLNSWACEGVMSLPTAACSSASIAGCIV